MVPQTKGSIELYQTEIARRTARRTAGASRIRPLRVSWRPSLAAVVIVCAIVALTVVAPAASAARQDTENSLKLTIGVDATFETPTLSISVQVSGQVAAFGIPWDIAGLTIPISYIVRAVATLSGQSDTCSVQTTGVVTADASVEMAPEADLVGWQVAIHAVGDRARCQALGQDMITDWEFLVEHASKTEPSTGEVIVESRSSSRVSLQVVDTRTGTPIAGRVSASTLRSRTVVEPSEPDKTGRVKVQFHWDKAESSTWIRVAEPHTMGSMILPRLKWEVAVGGAILEGSSERREELRLEFPESRVDPPSIVFRSRSGHRLMFDDADLARQESLVTGAGSWVGEVPEDEGQVSGVVEFGAALRLDDRRQPDEPVRGGGDSPRAPVVDQQHHEVRDLADVNGQDLLGTAPSVRFGTSVEAPAPSAPAPTVVTPAAEAPAAITEPARPAAAPTPVEPRVAADSTPAAAKVKPLPVRRVKPKEVAREAPAAAAPTPAEVPAEVPAAAAPPGSVIALPREAAKPPTDGKVVPLRPAAEAPAAAQPVPAAPGRVAAPAAAAAPAPPAPPTTPTPEVRVPAAPAAPAPTPADVMAEVPAAVAPVKREVIRLTESVTVADLAERLKKKSGEVVRELVGMGVMIGINQLLDIDKAKAVAGRLGFDVEARPLEGPEAVEEEVDPTQLRLRPPVVTVMGHVDHGKTSLLDAIRKTKVTEREFGGITQHIGAYQVETSHGKVTFLDTPGHEAFTAMRARGAQATDIVILVVAADDGVMPQTVEAVNHAKAAGVPIIVALNKVDKADANPDRVKQELSNLGLVPEEWGGQTIFVATSAKKGTGVDSLLEMTALQAEIMELKANPNRAAKGVVVEARLDRGRGPVATVLIQQGTLKEGDIVVAGRHHGRIRALFNDRRQRVEEAGPADPVEVLGLSGVPSAGDTLVAVAEERKARQIALARQERERKVISVVRVTLADLHKQIEAGEVKELRVILKGDVHGSLEALQDALERLSTDEVKVRVIHGAVGSITETDVMLASASNAIIIGFNVKSEPKAVQQAQAEQVDIKAYNVIYEAINDVKAALEGMLAPLIREVFLGRAQVRALFPIKNLGTIAGSFVSEGKITRTGKARVLRGAQVIGEGQVDSLRRFKDDVREVLQGMECGIGVSGVNDVRVGDVIEAYTTEEVARTL